MWAVNDVNDVIFNNWCERNKVQLRQWAYSIYQFTSLNSSSSDVDQLISKAIEATITSLNRETQRTIDAAISQARHEKDLIFQNERCELLHQIQILQDRISMADEHARTAVEKALNDESSLTRSAIRAAEAERKEIQDRHHQEISKFIQDYMLVQASSVKKGASAEVEYEQMLMDLYPDSAVERCGQSAGSCDIQMRLSQNARPILLEIKAYTRNVPHREVNKFERDLSTQQCHGILVSATSGITHRANMTVQLVDNQWVAVFLPHHKRNEDSLRVAIDLIHNGPWSKKMDADNNTERRLNEQHLAQINELLRQLMLRDTRIIEQLKAAQRSLSTSLIKDLTSAILTDSKENEGEEEEEEEIKIQLKCDQCDYTCGTKGGLTRHKNKMHASTKLVSVDLVDTI